MRWLFAAALGLCTLLPAPEARCVYCPTYQCYSEAMCNGCTCVRPQPYLPGQCLYFGR